MADEDIRVKDGIQHGIDDNPNDDAKKGAALGGLGGAAVGAAAGSIMGPGGAILGGVIGAVAGAAASGAAVAAVDGIDNDDTVSGLGEGITPDRDEYDEDTTYTGATTYDRGTGAYSDTGHVGTSDIGTEEIITTGATPYSAGTRGSAGVTTSSPGYGMTGDVNPGDRASLPLSGTPSSRAGEIRVPVTEETAQVDRVTRETGQLGVSKKVDTETRHISEPVERTRVIVEERDLGTGAGPAAAARNIQEGQVLSVPVTEEELVVQKVPHTREMIVRTEKETQMSEQDITLRKERAEIDVEGDAEVEGPLSVGSGPRT